MLVLGSNFDDDAAAHPNIAWRSQLVNNITSDLMFMNPKAVSNLIILPIYTRAAKVMFSAILPMEALLDLLTLLGSFRIPDEDPA